MIDKITREPSENCPIHPSQPYDWDGHEWSCGYCFLGRAPESTYGKVLQEVKKAMAEQDAATYLGNSNDTEAYAETATKNIMALFDEAIKVMGSAVKSADAVANAVLEMSDKNVRPADEVREELFRMLFGIPNSEMFDKLTNKDFENAAAVLKKYFVREPKRTTG